MAEQSELEDVAIWLRTVSKEAGREELVRELIRQAWVATKEMYGLPNMQEADETSSPTTALGRFAGLWDEHAAFERNDEQPGKH